MRDYTYNPIIVICSTTAARAQRAPLTCAISPRGTIDASALAHSFFQIYRGSCEEHIGFHRAQYVPLLENIE